MLHTIVKYMSERLGDTGLFSRIMGLCEIVVRDQETFPAQWCNGEYKRATDYDKYNGFGYWRKNGDVSLENSISEISANRRQIQYSYPLRFVLAIPQKKLGKYNNAYRNDLVAQEVVKAINQSASNVKNSLRARTVNFNVTGYTDNRTDIQSAEFSQSHKIRYEYIYMAFDVTANVTINSDCIKGICEEEMIADFDILDFNSKDFFTI